VWQHGIVRCGEFGPRYFGDQLGYNHAVLLESPQRWLVLAGHEARDDTGAIAHRDDIRGQLRLTFQRLEETLQEAGFALGDVVQLRIVTTNIATTTANYDVITGILAEANCRPASLLAEIQALSDPDMLVEIEALAAQ
jgi:enamine deaminase RidA (YjgF/YER057c/UK114 family)